MGKCFCHVVLFLLAALEAIASPLESRLSCRRFTTLDGLPQMQTETVWQDSEGYIYIGTLSGFVRYDGRSLEPFLRGRRENIVSFQQIGGEVRALGFVRQWTVGGRDVKQSPIDPQNQLLLNNFNASDLPDGYILLEDRQEQNRLLCRLLPKGYEKVMDSPLLDEMTPDRKMFLDSGGVYIPTPEGLYRSKDGKTILLNGSADVFSLIHFKGDLLALAADGIYTVVADSLKLRFSHVFESPDYGLYARQNRHGQLIIADSHTVWLYDESNSVKMRQLASGFNMIKALFIDKWNRLWVASYQGAYCFFHCNFTNHRLDDENDIVRAISFADGHLVMGTLNGNVLSGGELISSSEDNFYSPGAASLGGKVYMAGNGDVVEVEGDKLRPLGLPQDRYRFVATAGERLIVGARGTVLSYLPETGRIDTLTSEIVHPWCAAYDGKGRLWVSGNPGLYCLTEFEIGRPKVVRTKETPTSQVITAMAGDGNGTVCYALADSLFVIQSGKERLMTEVSHILSGHEIRSLHVSGRGYLVVAAIDGLMVARMDANGKANDIHWFDSGSGFTTVEPLLGTMAETDDGTIWLAGLEEMTSFRPDALIADNQESTVVEAPRPWWRHWWIWLAAGVILIGIVWTAARLVEKRIAMRKMALLEREKTQKELQLRAVRLKSIPHFHSNVLAGIEYFVMNKSADEASRYLKLYSDFTNQTLSDIDKPCRTVADEVEYVRSYLELERLRYGDRLNYSIDIAPDVGRNTMLPTMLLHTYCENAVKHGISSKVGEGRVEVRIIRQSIGGVEGVLVSVADDGVGRDEAARSGGYSTKQGLKILQQQIELYNKANRHGIKQSVVDLTDSGGRPSGTRFETWIPKDYQF